MEYDFLYLVYVYVLKILNDFYIFKIFYLLKKMRDIVYCD